MDFLLSNIQRVVVPEPRPVMTGPSTAAREPDPKPVAGDDDKVQRHHGHHEQRGRSHVQQGLHHVVREIRHAIRDEVKAGLKSGEIDHETMGTIRDLERDFRRDLHNVFLDAGRAGGIQRNQVLEGMIEALQSLAAGLREIADEDPQPVKVDPAIPAPGSEPGSLVDLTG